MGHGEDPLDANKCFLDLDTLKAREDSAIRQAELDAERFGVGVTAEAQSIFDALAKTHPVRWDKTVIVVMNEVRVSSPYLPESVKGGTPAANERVRKVWRAFDPILPSWECIRGLPGKCSTYLSEEF
nr:protein LSM12 homolog [Ipomoea batatas]